MPNWSAPWGSGWVCWQNAGDKSGHSESVGREIGHILFVWVWQHFENNPIQTSLDYNYDMTLLLPKSTKLPIDDCINRKIYISIFKSPRVTGGLIDFGLFPPPPRCSANTFHTFQENPWSLFLQTAHDWPMGVGNFLSPISLTLGKGHLATEAGRNLPCPQDKVRTAFFSNFLC